MTLRVETDAEEVIERPIKAVGNGAHVLVPKRWFGRTAKVVLMPDRKNATKKPPTHPSWEDAYEEWKNCKTDWDRFVRAFQSMPSPNKMTIWQFFSVEKKKPSM